MQGFQTEISVSIASHKWQCSEVNQGAEGVDAVCNTHLSSAAETVASLKTEGKIRRTTAKV
jgi:hypothetical protein